MKGKIIKEPGFIGYKKLKCPICNISVMIDTQQIANNSEHKCFNKHEFKIIYEQ
jgi:hypothetical protein